MSNGLNVKKGFADYQKELNDNKDVIVEDFCKGLSRYNIDLRRIDKLIVERKVGIVFVRNTIITEKSGVGKEIYSKIANSYYETEVLRDIRCNVFPEQSPDCRLHYSRPRHNRPASLRTS